MHDKPEITAKEEQLKAPEGWSIASLNTFDGGMGEGQGFNCSLRINGKKVADVINGGTGGPNIYRPADGYTMDDINKWEQEVLKALDTEPSPYGLMLDDVIFELIDAKEMETNAKRFAKKHQSEVVLFYRTADDDEFTGSIIALKSVNDIPAALDKLDATTYRVVYENRKPEINSKKRDLSAEAPATKKPGRDSINIE